MALSVFALYLIAGAKLRKPPTPPALGAIAKGKGNERLMFMGVAAGWMPMLAGARGMEVADA